MFLLLSPSLVSVCFNLLLFIYFYRDLTVPPRIKVGVHRLHARRLLVLLLSTCDKWDPGKASGPEHHRQGAPAEEIEEMRAVITRWLHEERILAQKTISPGASSQQGVGGFAWRHDLLRKIGYKR